MIAPCPCCVSVVGAVRGWPHRKGPAPVLRGRFNWDLPAWIDHAYRLQLPNGRCCYVAEPYGLPVDAFADLAYLVEQGFDIAISAARARHYPGHTIAIEITSVGDRCHTHGGRPVASSMGAGVLRAADTHAPRRT